MVLADIFGFAPLLVLVLSGSSSAFPTAQPSCRQRQGNAVGSPSSSITFRGRFSLFERAINTASSSSTSEENDVSVELIATPNHTKAQTNDAVSLHKRHDNIDKISFVEQTENIPLGHLTHEVERDMLSLMRQLSLMARRHDEIISSSSPDGERQSHTQTSNKDSNPHNGLSRYARQRRQDATIVERLLDRLLHEYQYSVNNTNDSISEQREQRNGNSARTYNLAIKAWANANIRGSAEKAERVLKRLKIASNYGQLGNSSTKCSSRRHPPPNSLGPDIYSFAYCYAAWYKESIFASKQIDNMKASKIALRRAESVLQSMRQLLMLRKRGDNDETIIVDEYEWNMAEDVNSLLTMWSATDPTLPEMQDTFLRFIEVESRDLADLWLNTKSFNLVINGKSLCYKNDSFLSHCDVNFRNPCIPFDVSMGEEWKS